MHNTQVLFSEPHLCRCTILSDVFANSVARIRIKVDRRCVGKIEYRAINITHVMSRKILHRLLLLHGEEWRAQRYFSEEGSQSPGKFVSTRSNLHLHNSREEVITTRVNNDVTGYALLGR